MLRRERKLIGITLAAVAGVVLLLGALLWVLWSDSIETETAVAGRFASALGERTEAILLDTRDLLAEFDRLPDTRCSSGHLQAMQDAAISRPWLRAIGHWRGVERLCSVGFLQSRELKPTRADRIYESGVVAWWPSEQTEVGGVRLFLMRFGDHDAAIDPRMLIEIGPLQQRQVGLWVENLPLATQPVDADLPNPRTLATGVSIDAEAGRIVSHFSHRALLPVDVVAIEPFASFWQRNMRTLVISGVIAVLLSAAWIDLMRRYSRQRLSLDAELHESVARGQIGVQYQPVVSLCTGKCIGAEALARWTRDNGEAVSPETFIPIAERTGLVSQITLAVLSTVIHDLSKLRRLQPSLHINLNLSAHDLKDERFAAALGERLQRADVPPGAITLEITERALVDSDIARGMVHRFRQNGHRVAVDDFGTGYSSLSYLETFELDVLKIDRSFVEAIEKGSASSSVIEHVIGMARSLGLETVAEGVQTEAQRQWLLAHGVNAAQGFLFSPPLDVDDLAAFFNQHEGV